MKSLKNFILITILFLLLIVIGIIKTKLPNYKIQICGFSIWIVETGSMLPELNIGEAIIIKENKDYEIGDVITYKEKNLYYVTHRIIEKTPEGFYTKGDNNNVKDKDIVLSNQIEGKVVFHSIILGYIIKYSWILIILLFLIIILYT